MNAMEASTLPAETSPSARTIVFSGPSLAEAELRQFSTASHAPPIKRGDLATVDDYEIVVILDGEFGQSESVSPKEILASIERGKTVIGAASMGALRASELDRDGMIGAGSTSTSGARRYAATPMSRSLTRLQFLRRCRCPMVDVEYWMERTSAAGLIGNRSGLRAEGCSKHLSCGPNERTACPLLGSRRRRSHASVATGILRLGNTKRQVSRCARGGSAGRVVRQRQGGRLNSETEQAASPQLTELIARALLDADLRHKLLADPELIARAFGLTADETLALRRLDRQTFEQRVAEIRSA